MLETVNWEEKGEEKSASTDDERKSWRKMDGLQRRQEKEMTEENPPGGLLPVMDNTKH